MKLVELNVRDKIASYPRAWNGGALHLKSQIFYGVENALWKPLIRLSMSTRYGGNGDFN